MRPVLSALLVAAWLGASASARAAEPEPARWISRWDHEACQLIRAVGDPLAERLSIRTTPGSGNLSLWVVHPGASRAGASAPGRGEIFLSPSGARTVSNNVVRSPREEDVVFVIGPLEERLLDAMASSSAIRIAVDGSNMFELPLGNVRAAVDVLRQCINDQLRTWGIDPAALASLRERPRPVHPGGLAGLVSPDDYPMRALRERASGTTVVRLDVDPAGRVTTCTVLASSEHAALDAATCRAMRRARFHPAIDAAGNPAGAPTVTEILWTAR